MPQDIENAIQGSFAAQQMLDPRLKGVTLEPMSALTKWMVGPGVDAKHHSALPWENRISYDPDALGTKGAPSIDALVAHELTHARQRADQGYLGNLWNRVKEGFYSYGMGPMEREAFDAENHTPMQGRDVQLPAESVAALKRRSGR